MASLDAAVMTIMLVSAGTFVFIFCSADILFRAYGGDLYNGMSKKKRLDWMARFSSTVHAVLVTVLSTYALVTETQLREEPVWSQGSIAVVTLAIVAGYMIADVLIIFWNFSYLGEVGFIYHHLLSASTCCVVLSYRAFEYFAVWRMLTELSTPFLNLRFYLDDADRRMSKLYVVNGLLFTATFLGTRILALPHYYYVLYTAHGTPAFIQAGKLGVMPYVSGLAMDAVNMIWARKVVRGFLKGIRQLRASASKAAAVELVAPVPASKGLKTN